jgi:UPF0755 protein
MRFFIAFLLLVFSSLGLFLYLSLEIEDWSSRPVILQSSQVVSFPKNTSLKQLSAELEGKKVLDRALFFRLWIRFHSDFRKFQAGNYLFEGSTTPNQIIEKMIKGEVYLPVVLEYTIPEGFSLSQIISRLEEKKVATKEELETVSRSKEFFLENKITADSFEGYFYPATYQFTEMPNAQKVFSEAIKVFRANLPDDYENRALSLGLTLHQAVTFASLIEIETAHSEERSKISEVIWNRLKANETLGIDASVIYGASNYRGDLTFKHLQDEQNLYNTRVHKGLPPGPIGSPSKASLEAVIAPTSLGYFYYVLDADTIIKPGLCATGSSVIPNSHHFSKTLAEHNSYVRKLVEASRK